MKMWSLSEDWAESILLVLSILVAVSLWFSVVAVFAGVVGAASLLRLLTQAAGRKQLQEQTRFVTRDGLLVVGKNVPKLEYVEKITQQVVEWCCEDFSIFKSEEIVGVFDGVVVEFVEPPFPHWGLGQCPWPMLPWEEGKWIRVGLNADGRSPALPYELMSRILFFAGGYTSAETRDAVIDDIGFDLNG